MEKSIIGRENEIRDLNEYINSDRSEFIALYGRRRVGKTFLIKELFEGKFTFRITGKENSKSNEQLQNFSYEMDEQFGIDDKYDNWTEALRALQKAIERNENKTKIIFIDELPWLDTPKGKFISALEYFWNNWAYYRNDIKLIVCGSATSWMLNNIINARGGLHNRVTHQMLITPFTLNETERFFRERKINYERTEIIDCYMAVGGVAYYLSLFKKDQSAAENISRLCFDRKGELKNEFDKIYKSIFKKSENHIEIVNALSETGKGMTRLDIINKTSLNNNGKLTTLLNELEACDFIRSYVPFGKGKKEKLYQLIDQFSLFHLNFIKGQSNFEKDYWIKTINTGAYKAWSGYAFETVCLNHIDQIIEGLGISGSLNHICSWAYRPTDRIKNNDEIDEELKKGAQIDLLIDRSDKTITICEMKYSANEYEIDKDYDKRVQERLRTFRKVSKTNKTLATAYVTPQGLVNNVYSRKGGVRQITADHLFK